MDPFRSTDSMCIMPCERQFRLNIDGQTSSELTEAINRTCLPSRREGSFSGLNAHAWKQGQVRGHAGFNDQNAYVKDYDVTPGITP
jgi:hypothetical protein